MGYGELLLIGVGLSMDAFAASICKGLSMGRIRWRQGAALALLFGGFQALMPLAGWALGRQFEGYITSVDHWIAFLLLGWIGGKMIWDAFRNQEESCPAGFDIREALMLAVATSIDALAVGVTFALLPGVDIAAAASLIGATTFLLSALGLKVGNVFGLRYKSRAELAGGAILILMGVKILLEHLGILTF